MRLLIFADLGRVDIYVHDGRARRKRLQLSRHTIVEAHAERQQQVLGFRGWGLGFRVSGFGFRVSGFGFRVSGLGFRV